MYYEWRRRYAAIHGTISPSPAILTLCGYVVVTVPGVTLLPNQTVPAGRYTKGSIGGFAVNCNVDDFNNNAPGVYPLWMLREVRLQSHCKLLPVDPGGHV